MLDVCRRQGEDADVREHSRGADAAEALSLVHRGGAGAIPALDLLYLLAQPLPAHDFAPFWYVALDSYTQTLSFNTKDTLWAYGV